MVLPLVVILVVSLLLLLPGMLLPLLLPPLLWGGLYEDPISIEVRLAGLLSQRRLHMQYDNSFHGPRRKFRWT